MKKNISFVYIGLPAWNCSGLGTIYLLDLKRNQNLTNTTIETPILNNNVLYKKTREKRTRNNFKNAPQTKHLLP